MLGEGLIHDAADFTVDDTAASLAEHREAQCQQLLDLFGYVEPPDPVALADPMVQKRSPAIGLLFGMFVGINTRVGREFYANAGVRIHDHAPVAIGRHVGLGPNVSLLTEGHAMDAEEWMRGVVVARPIEIGGDVWIRAGVSVFGGVKIGNRGVVGAGSLVNRDVRMGKVVVGVPARVVRRKGRMKLGGEAAGQAGMVGNGVTDCFDA
jgi:acetyltransferase-like isoleucine patch superfamily enzyme